MASYEFKVVLLGQGCVGKTSLALRYVSGVFNDSHQSTFQASFLRKQLYLERDLVKLNLWDTAGQEKYHALGPIYYRGAQGALLLYDVTNPESLQKVKEWARELNKMEGPDKIKLCIVGNKIDLLDPSIQRKPQNWQLIQEAMKLANEIINARHYVISAKQNRGIGEMFLSLSKRMIDQHRKRLAIKMDSSKQSDVGRTYNRNIARTLSLADDCECDWEPNSQWPPVALEGRTTGDKGGPCQC